jgi:hypothetical protein
MRPKSELSTMEYWKAGVSTALSSERSGVGEPLDCQPRKFRTM